MQAVQTALKEQVADGIAELKLGDDARYFYVLRCVEQHEKRMMCADTRSRKDYPSRLAGDVTFLSGMEGGKV